MGYATIIDIINLEINSMKTILISGANGFIAKNFMAVFSQKYKFICLSHIKQEGHITLEDLASNQDLISSVDVVLNLAGANIGDKRWSIERKNELLTSRLKTTLELAVIFNEAGAKVHFISASAVGIYATGHDNNEDTPINYHEYANFSQQLTRQWENMARAYEGKLSITRFGVVLSYKGGAFPKMLRPFLFGMGGSLGGGSQKFPWIALTDLINAIEMVIEKQSTGIYNLVAPQVISNNDLVAQISTIWHKPRRLRLSANLIRLIFGQMGQELFLNSLTVRPTRLLAEDFTYQYPWIENCLKAIKLKQL